MQQSHQDTYQCASHSGRTRSLRSKIGLAVATGLAVALAACQPATKTIEIDPGPPVRPTPPLGAAEGMYVPPADEVSGKRLTPNSNLSMDETIWHYRMAFNVAALSCRDPGYESMGSYYTLYMNNNFQALDRVNNNLDRDFKARYPAGNSLRIRDTHSTDMYSYFSLPPVKQIFCKLMIERAPTAASLSEAELYSFSKIALDEIDDMFQKFYADYEDYLRRLAEWEALYGRAGIVTVGGGALYDTNTPQKPTMPQ